MEKWISSDPAVNNVLRRMVDRSDAGMKKYGRPIGDSPGDLKRWLLEIQEEITDAAVYIERALIEIDKKS